MNNKYLSRLITLYLLLNKSDTVQGTTLKEAAAGLGVYIGTAVTIDGFSDETYMNLVSDEFDLITAENSCKMSLISQNVWFDAWINPDFWWRTFTFQGQFIDTPLTFLDYDNCDAIFELAKTNGQAFRGHTAMWANVGSSHYTPDHISSLTDVTEIESFLENYIKTTVGRYAGQGVSWDVVNEAMDPTCYNDTSCVVVRDSVWTKIDDFMCKAFTWAREADPTALLFYNDFNHSTKEGYWEVKSTAIYDLVNDLKTRNCGIDGVGFQLHEDIDFSSRVANVKTNIQRYLDIDVLVHFTEVDIKCRKDSNDVCEDWTDANLAAQATTYGDLLTACLEYSNCESFETWGFTDKYTWHAAPMYPLPWDENFNKKSTYDTLLSTLQNFDRSDSAVTTRVANRDTRAEYLYLDGSVKVGIASSALLVSLIFTTW